METIEKGLLGVAGEFFVAAELCRRGIYAQPTFGSQKRLDLLACGADGKMLRLEVKSKQGNEWPNCKGIHGDDVFIVFVDFKGKGSHEKPDFYVLSSAEWRSVVLSVKRTYKKRHPNRRALVGNNNVLVLPDEVSPTGKAYCGVGVRPSMLDRFNSDNPLAKIAVALGQ